MPVLVYIACGGAVGSVLRYLASSALARWLGTGFPYGTLGVNVLGSLLMGMVVSLLVLRHDANPVWHPLLVVGVLGGFTTFSAFSLDILQLIQRGQMVPAVLYVALSVFVSLAALATGFTLMKAFCA